MDVIQNDYIKNFEGSDITFMRVHSKKQEINYKEDLQHLIDKAFLKGEIIKEMEEGLTYTICYKLSELDNITDLFKKIKDPRVFYINGMKGETENYTPFPFIFKNKKALMEFYNGNLIIMVIIDLKVFRNKITQKGYSFEYNDDGEFIITFKHNGENKSILASNYHITRIGREFLSLQWFIDGIEDVINNIIT